MLWILKCVIIHEKWFLYAFYKYLQNKNLKSIVGVFQVFDALVLMMPWYFLTAYQTLESLKAW